MAIERSGSSRRIDQSIEPWAFVQAPHRRGEQLRRLGVQGAFREVDDGRVVAGDARGSDVRLFGESIAGDDPGLWELSMAFAQKTRGDGDR